MLDRLLPPTFDNTYSGHNVALWLFGLLVFMKAAMSLSSIFSGESVASSADGIPLDTYPPAAARTIVSLFALFGLSLLVLCALSVLVLVRYRSMVPLMYVLFLLEHAGRKLILQFLPIVRTGQPPAFAINLAILALTIIGLALSLWKVPHR
ncbi:MAG TPA: hypothetical protein VNA69_18575 [Thermoanaerobaculia bacterium]|nr:hypothetical protein [Thermoanaerobaculia bacterium]